MSVQLLTIDSVSVQVVYDFRNFVRALLRPLLIVDLLIFKLIK